MDTTRKTVMLLSLILTTTTGALCAAETAPLEGSWMLQTNVAGVQKERQCVFSQKAAAFAGTCQNADGTVSVAGKVDGNKVSFQYKVDFAGQSLTIVCSGSLRDSGISGSVEAQPIGVPGEFTLARTK